MMSEKKAGGDGLPSSLAGMSKNELYDIMCQVKALVEQNQQQARQILIQNPALTRALFQAQIILGMVLPPRTVTAAPSVQLKDSQPTLQSNPQQPSPLPNQTDQTHIRRQPQNQTMISGPSVSIPPPIPQTQQPISSPSMPSTNPPKGPTISATSAPMSSPQVPSISQLPHRSAPQPQTQVHLQPPMPLGSTQPQQQLPMQSTGTQYQPLQPPLPPQPRPQMQNFSHQMPPQMGPNFGFQQHPSGVQQMHPSQQSMFYSGNKPGPSFQPPNPSQPPQPPLYQTGNQQLGVEFNQGGTSRPGDRGSTWVPGVSDASHLPGPPPQFAAQTGPSSQPPRPPPLSPEMEKALLQQVMSLTPEQINMLPADQRNQILQLQQMLRQ